MHAFDRGEDEQSTHAHRSGAPSAFISERGIVHGPTTSLCARFPAAPRDTLDSYAAALSRRGPVASLGPAALHTALTAGVLRQREGCLSSAGCSGWRHSSPRSRLIAAPPESPLGPWPLRTRTMLAPCIPVRRCSPTHPAPLSSCGPKDTRERHGLRSTHEQPPCPPVAARQRRGEDLP